jgi:hypothetical protein
MVINQPDGMTHKISRSTAARKKILTNSPNDSRNQENNKTTTEKKFQVKISIQQNQIIKIFFFLLKNPKMTMGSATKMNRLMAALNHRFNLPYRT